LRQAQRQRARRRERKGAASPRIRAAQAERAGDGATAARVIRRRRVPVKPMSVDEAALELEGRPEGVLVFRDARTERVQVIFRRRDGNLGLIEPEA
jgi:putative sigma-54 modulation protein